MVVVVPGSRKAETVRLGPYPDSGPSEVSSVPSLGDKRPLRSHLWLRRPRSRQRCSRSSEVRRPSEPEHLWYVIDVHEYSSR